eukprot:SAG31_NODE_4919_length_2868_cov_1.265800_1_plen_84_part_00
MRELRISKLESDAADDAMIDDDDDEDFEVRSTVPNARACFCELQTYACRVLTRRRPLGRKRSQVKGGRVNDEVHGRKAAKMST